MYKKVLVAIDGSNTSALALKEAIKFIEEHPKTSVRIIHVIDEYTIPSYISYAISASAILEHKQAIKNAGITLLKNAEIEIQATKTSNFETKLIEMKNPEDHIYQIICDEANSWSADLIIIGTHGRKGFNRFLLGSVAEGVARMASVPVLLIRGKETLL